ncbi:uncharacterized protein LOC129409904 [Boleophthalmus pectinirostris]|uniref:uncharacterized protein LOC129409904 n=1 Tax=Boleophthalmus pectinirostris TaxID=150288 RepID=UPI0024320A2B|nr:uncharacterized protein LOC129409904 [Boleophthalmus pectinirostris]
MNSSALTVAFTSLCVWMMGALGDKKLEVELGENVTLSCSNISKETTQVDWFRVENGTKARCISSVFGSDDEPSYCSGFKHSRFQMNTNKTLVFLTIYQVQTSDSGLYFCGFFIRSNVVLEESTYLSVEDHADPTNSAMNENPQTGCFSWIPLTTIALWVLSGILAVVVIILAIKYSQLQKVSKELQKSANEVRSEEPNYAAINIKATKRPQTLHRQMEPQVIYSSTR